MTMAFSITGDSDYDPIDDLPHRSRRRPTNINRKAKRPKINRTNHNHNQNKIKDNNKSEDNDNCTKNLNDQPDHCITIRRGWPLALAGLRHRGSTRSC